MYVLLSVWHGPSLFSITRALRCVVEEAGSPLPTEATFEAKKEKDLPGSLLFATYHLWCAANLL